ncbi:predicted protein [Aspergillus terreus NIH2624]|uniref:Cation/H+ exchanger transmembrane domain-containing protein n=1 Tax=Aspergillus terreus (strain NIH 2624 / FGSC A1156) TaxID=341663 RepID=Q0CV83_ASPTN|nr:uncharacterized protein ATEG_02401 [Aspergillus terreus NIH2624]EAU37363.1 predicted protein [Aspergillus terreus NIH2624]
MNFDPSDFNVICALLGLLMSVYGLLAYLIRERCYLSDALISFILGVLLGPVTGLVDPMRLAQNDVGNIDRITSAFSRLVLGVQLVIVGIQLPKRYLIYEWRSLAVLLLPGLTCMWMISSILVWLVLPPVPFLHALAIGACISPTDPVLSSAIVKGAFADKYVPLDLRRLIIAESGANDGLGYPFLFLPLLILRYSNSETTASGLWQVLSHWFGETWFYVILLSVVYGAVLGWCAQSMLHFTAMREYLDRETFTIFSISLSLLVLGTAGMANSDDILACFITGNSFTMNPSASADLVGDIDTGPAAAAGHPVSSSMGGRSHGGSCCVHAGGRVVSDHDQCSGAWIIYTVGDAGSLVVRLIPTT